jgi:hypothetical protein
MVATTVWVYTVPSADYKIVRRSPFQLHIEMSEFTNILPGVAIELPQWSQVVSENGRIWATYQSELFDVTDLYR